MHSRPLLFLVCWLCVASAGISATLFSVYLPLIAADLHAGDATPELVGRTGSLAGSAFLVGWAVGAFALGALGDRVGRRFTLITSVLLCTLGIIATAFVQSLPVLVVVRFVTGAGAGSVLLMAAVIIAEEWRTGNRARMVGIIMNAFPVGLIASGVIARSIGDWRTAYLVGGSTIVLALLAAVVVRDSNLWNKSERHDLAQLVQPEHRKDLVTGILMFGAMLVGLWAVFVWMPTWVHKMSHAETAQSNRGIVNIMLGMGSVVGGLLAGPLAEKAGRRGATIVGYCGCIVLTIVTFATGIEPSALLFGLTFVLSAFIGINQGVLGTYLNELFPTRIRAAAAAVCMNVGRLITAVTVIFVGVLVQMFGGYDNAILVFSGAYIIGLVVAIKARETRGVKME